jgi:hypothetical protein
MGVASGRKPGLLLISSLLDPCWILASCLLDTCLGKSPPPVANHLWAIFEYLGQNKQKCLVERPGTGNQHTMVAIDFGNLSIMSCEDPQGFRSWLCVPVFRRVCYYRVNVGNVRWAICYHAQVGICIDDRQGFSPSKIIHNAPIVRK